MKKWIKEEDVMGVLGIAPPELLADHIADLDGVWMEDEDVEDVVLERLEAAADALGYELVKKKKNGVAPCPQCGCEDVRLRYHLYKHTSLKTTKRHYYYECSKCHLRSRRDVCNRTDIARQDWNSMVGEMRCK
jgi:hypothetical protein